MSRRPRPGEIQPSFDQGDALIQRAATLGHNITAYAELMSGVSREALQAIESPVLGTHLEEKWPLAGEFIIRDLMLTEAGSKLKEPLGSRPPLTGDSKTYAEASLVGHKYYTEDLAEVYGSENPRLAVARDLVGWANGMAERGWPVIADLNLRGEHSVEVDVYQATDDMRAYLGRSTTPNSDPEDTYPPARWLSPRVIAAGELEELDRLSAHIPARV